MFNLQKLTSIMIFQVMFLSRFYPWRPWNLQDPLVLWPLGCALEPLEAERRCTGMPICGRTWGYHGIPWDTGENMGILGCEMMWSAPGPALSWPNMTKQQLELQTTTPSTKYSVSACGPKMGEADGHPGAVSPVALNVILLAPWLVSFSTFKRWSLHVAQIKDPKDTGSV